MDNIVIIYNQFLIVLNWGQWSSGQICVVMYYCISNFITSWCISGLSLKYYKHVPIILLYINHWAVVAYIWLFYNYMILQSRIYIERLDGAGSLHLSKVIKLIGKIYIFSFICFCQLGIPPLPSRNKSYIRTFIILYITLPMNKVIWPSSAHGACALLN